MVRIMQWGLNDLSRVTQLGSLKSNVDCLFFKTGSIKFTWKSILPLPVLYVCIPQLLYEVLRIIGEKDGDYAFMHLKDQIHYTVMNL